MSNDDSHESADWLRHRGFGIVVEEHDGTFWAHLTRFLSDDVVARDFGRGDSRSEAMERARSRYEAEQ